MTDCTYHGLVSVIVDGNVMYECRVIGQGHYNHVVARLMETFSNVPHAIVSDLESWAMPSMEKEIILETL